MNTRTDSLVSLLFLVSIDMDPHLVTLEKTA